MSQQQTSVAAAAATLPSAPAYSFGTRPGYSCTDAAGPGPGAPPPLASSSEHQRVRSCGFGTSSRPSLCTTGGAAAPAPGEYSCDAGMRATHRRMASATMPGRPQPGRAAAQQPGPGHYSTRTASTHPAAPAVSISHRLPGSTETERHPGPGEYDAAAFHATLPLPVTIKHRRPASALDRPDSGHAVPGPGAYVAKDACLSTRSSSPAHTMAGARPASCSALQQLPGPADYSPHADSSRTKAGAGCSFGTAEKQPGSRYEVRPGPGSYFTHSVAQHPSGHSLESTHLSAPAPVIGCRQAAAALSASPGPGEYDARDALGRRSSPCYSFKGVDAKDVLAANPAPNAYNPARSMAVVRVAPPAVSIGQRYAPPGETQRRPGPGEYDVGAGSSEKPGVSLKFRHARKLDSATAAPGPGEYAVDARSRGRRSPQFSMGMRLPAAPRQR